ncbi:MULTISPECIES: nitrate- and nitrite sensing domain-containing protein [unclassified Streptomyces]|uniref:sensor histidine kinase n=1 Tax=unclassified Streptomyces TaxID=2593676 RepID=UPI000377AE38|nr:MULTISPECIES: nitrate- and nitrite sensing domain-containing protein [unclassified Streptomyces]MYQ80644.1 HAMP domain-containing protein [Streptomyces sp. SID4923]
MQGRFKRDGSAAAEQEPRGGTDRGSSPQHAQNPGSAAAGDQGDRDRRPGAAPAGGEPEQAAAPKPRGPVNTGSRVALRNWRISTRLVSLLALPVVAATTLGGLRINDSLNDIQQLEHMQLLTEMTKQATSLAQALQEERDQTAGPLSNDVPETDFKITTPRQKTDKAQLAFLASTSEIGDTTGDDTLESIHTSIQQIATRLSSIRDTRKHAYEKGSPALQTVDAYSQLITSLLSLSQDMAQATSSPEMIKRTRALAAFSSAKEYASIQRAIIAAALPTSDDKRPSLDRNDQQFGLAARSKEQAARTSFEAIYTSTGNNASELTASLDEGNPDIKAADTYAQKMLENPLAMGGSKARRSYMNWYDQDTIKINAMKRIEETLLSDMEGKARELREESQREAIISGALILLVLGVSLVGAFVVARSMIRSLRRLQDTATRVAQDRLPELVKQLSESDPQDVDTSVESVGVHSRDEIGKVAAAFDDVHREAVRLAAEQALLRGNVNAMFTNLSRRSQGLIQRQLSLISELESREADPDQLSSLFKLDHLATRMRRNGENLLVLAGEEPGRRWTRPVPLVDVLRAAASEVEQYERIELAAVPATEVAGRVVNDLVHLLAELLENATSFSSPQTKVRVTGHALPDGRVLVEIHDTGIGLSPEDLAAINERLASPPTVDVSVSRRMGLFVVGRLSLRHGIRIQLRPSDSGGTTALVMLPVDVAHGGRQPAPKQGPGQQSPGGLLSGGNDAQAGRPAAGPAPQRGQVGAGAGPRAALPARDGNRPQNPQGGPGAQDSAFQNPQGRPAQDGPRQGGGLSGAFGGARLGARGQGDGGADTNRPSLFDQRRPEQNGPGAPQAPQPQQARFDQPGQGGQDGQGAFEPPRGPGRGERQLPPVGGPRAELPGGSPAPNAGPNTGQGMPGGGYPGPQRPQTTSWGTDEPAAPRRSPLDAPRGHEDPETTGRFPQAPRLPADDRQGPGSTAEFARPDFSAPAPNGRQPGLPQHHLPQGNGPQAPQHNMPQHNGPLPGLPQRGVPQPNGPQHNGAYGNGPQNPDVTSTSQFARPDFGGPQQPAPRQRDNSQDFGAPRPPMGGQAPEAPYRPVLPQQPQQPEALPPAGPGDGRTPLYDTLETNWFRGPQPGAPQQPPAAPAQDFPQQPAQEPVAPAPQRTLGDSGAQSAWRASPNDEIVRQAERVKKPAAGGITTSGLPRRVPRANLVPGTAQQQNNQSGPQVSRAPDDVRGRLTNLRRGIQQGRQAGTGQTGSFPLGPTHQQER